MLQVEIKVDERLGGPWNLDLGAGGLEFFYPYAEENGLLERPGIRRMGLGAGGGMMSTVARFEKLEFAGYTLDNVRIGIPRAKGTGVFASREITGNAGNELFRHFVLYLDYARGQVIVEKGADFDRDFPADRSGLGLMLDREGRLEAVTVSEGTPAAEAGIHEGDIVISVDGRSVKEAGGIIAVREMLRASPGTKRNLELEREGKRLEATVVLREL
jgi:membrane-associated protease RseP (regulator of RpoE activity)